MHASKLYAPTAANLKATDEVAQREYRLLRAGVVLTLALACAGALALALVDPDLWGHIRYAEDWLATGGLPQTASHTFTAADHPWINHELLAELTLSLGYQHLGINGLLVAKCLLGLAIVGLMVRAARRHSVPLLLAWSLMLLVCANLHPFFVLRPQLLSFGFFSLMLALLERAFRGWDEEQTVCWWALWVLPAIFALWANTHGAFVVGLGIAGVLLGGRMIEMIARRRALRWDFFHLGVVGLCCAAVTLLNPYGVELHRWLWTSLIRPRPEITEWMPPSAANIVFWPWVAMLTVGVLSIATATRRRDWVKICILAVVAWQSALHVRHIAFLALLCGFWLPAYVHSALGRFSWDWLVSLEKLRGLAFFRRIAVVGLLLVIGWQSLRLDQQLSGLPVSRNHYPLDAVQFMADRGLQGKLVVSFNWAQYTVAALAPEVQVSFDGRFRTCYPQQVIDMNFDFLLGEFGGRRSRDVDSGKIDGTRVLKHCSPDLVLIDRRYENATAVMQAELPRWSLLYRDRVAEIWGRRERYDEPTSLNYFPLVMRVQDPRPRDGVVPWPALPIRESRSHLAEQTSNSEHLGG